MPDSSVLISGFSDEAAANKSVDLQFSVMAALGLQYVSLRFVDCGSGVRNIVDLDKSEQRFLQQKLSEYGLSVSSIGSPIGKVRIADVDDGTGNRFVPFDHYLRDEVPRAIDAALSFDCRLVRGFSFYHPRGEDAASWLEPSIERLGQIADLCDRNGLTFGLEVEANLIGHTGQLLERIHSAVANPALVLVFDAGNLVTQGFSSEQILVQFRAMLPGLGWMHVKDYHQTDGPAAGSFVDEQRLDRFVPADCGDAGHRRLFAELKMHLPSLLRRMQARNIPGFFVELEPHLRGGGQFGGFSGPDGMGLACRALCRVLAEAELSWALTQWEDLPRR